MKRFIQLFNRTINSRKKKTVMLFSVLVIILVGWKVFGSKSAKIQYQTSQVERGTLINTVSASGNISTVGNISILTQATGTIKNVYVKNGDSVVQGQKIAEITLDQNSSQKSTSAYASYLSAKNSLSSVQSSLYSLDSSMWAAQRVFMNDAVARGLLKDDPTYIQENDNWQAAQAKYISQQDVIAQAQASLSNAWITYQQLSSNITAPASGKINNLNIAPGLVIASQTTSSTTSTSLQSLGTITTANIFPQASANLSEVDVTKVKQGQKVMITLDALPDLTFTGKVLVINTNGQTSSNVTTYPVTIEFDSSNEKIYPNMGVNAEIIIDIKTDVLLVPSAVIQTSSGQSTVQILKNGKLSQVSVEIGNSNDTQTEIVSGLNEGDTVVTNIITSATTTSRTGTSISPFSSFGGGGGQMRINR